MLTWLLCNHLVLNSQPSLTWGPFRNHFMGRHPDFVIFANLPRKGLLLQITLTSEHDLIMLIDISFPVVSTTQSLIPPTQIFPISYSDITVHRSHHTLHFLLFVSLLHTQHATSMSNPTSIKSFTPDTTSIFIPYFN